MGSIDPRFGEIKELAEVCKKGDIERVVELLKKNPEVLDSPDQDTRFFYPESCIWSPLGIAARNGHEALVERLLGMGANPVPYEVAGQYHHHTYWDWTKQLRERHYDAIAHAIETAVEKRYGPLLDEADIRRAVIEGNVERVRTLIAAKPERVRQVDTVGNTALHVAVTTNNLEMTRLLIERGSAIDALNGSGRTPSVVALFGFHRWWRYEEKKEILDLLLKHGAEYKILIAATLGDEARVRELLRRDPTSANGLDPCQRRPLSGAVHNSHANIVRLLLEHGADPNGKEAVCQGGCSLHSASWQGNIEIVRLLLEHGAIPDHWVDSSGDSLFAALHNGHQEVLHLLYSYGGTMELMVYSARHRIDVIAEVLKADPSRAKEVLPYGWDDDGSEDLAYNIMRLAIRYGARFENASGWNLRWTALKYPKVFRLLQEHGASPDTVLLGVAGDMSRRYKTAERQLGVVKFLVEECGANLNCRDGEGFTPLALAAGEGHAHLVEYLLAKGADINADAPEWAKPRALAASRGHVEIVKMLGDQS